MLELNVFSPSTSAGAWAVARLIHPLNEFYERSELPLPAVEPIHPDEVPEPYKSLLVHRQDMTSTLENFHGQTARLRVLGREHRGELYFREVVLYLEGSNKPVEFGAIKMVLNLFDPAAREGILREHWPLGRVLRDESVLYSSRPKAFFKVTPDRFISRLLEVSGAPWLYGRRNVLYDPAEQPLAEVVEILPPEEASSCRGVES